MVHPGYGFQLDWERMAEGIEHVNGICQRLGSGIYRMRAAMGAAYLPPAPEPLEPRPKNVAASVFNNEKIKQRCCKDIDTNGFLYAVLEDDFQQGKRRGPSIC